MLINVHDNPSLSFNENNTGSLGIIRFLFSSLEFFSSSIKRVKSIDTKVPVYFLGTADRKTSKTLEAHSFYPRLDETLNRGTSR